jgi:hypothetical protein
MFYQYAFCLQAASFVIVIEYNQSDEEKCFSDLKALYEEFVSSRKKTLREIKSQTFKNSSVSGKEIRHICSAPLLVLLSIDINFIKSQSTTPECLSPESDTSDTDKQHRDEKKEDVLVEISTAVARTHEKLSELIRLDSTSSASMGWYVQPYGRKSAICGPFKDGVYAGINWLVRAMQKQDSRRNT